MIRNNSACSICCETDVSQIGSIKEKISLTINHILSAADTQSDSSCHWSSFFVFRLECVLHHLLNLFLTYISCYHCGTTFSERYRDPGGDYSQTQIRSLV